MSDRDPTDFMKPSSFDDTLPDWAQVRIDPDTPSIARVYDAVLDGKDNFAADREIAKKFRAVPGADRIPFDNRDWITRVVRYLVGEAGIRQIIDLGSGLPTANNVHEVAHAIAPDTKVAYVDNDPMVLAHGRAILGASPKTTVITADVADTDSLFSHPELTALIDLDKPFAVLLVAVLHHLPDGMDRRVAAAVREQIRSGCYLAVAAFHDPGEHDERPRGIEDALVHQGLGSGWVRPYPQHRLYFEGLELVSPGVVPAVEWRPDEDTDTDSPVRSLYVGGVGYRP
jgi:hypothetical protein